MGEFSGHDGMKRSPCEFDECRVSRNPHWLTSSSVFLEYRSRCNLQQTVSNRNYSAIPAGEKIASFFASRNDRVVTIETVSRQKKKQKKNPENQPKKKKNPPNYSVIVYTIYLFAFSFSIADF